MLRTKLVFVCLSCVLFTTLVLGEVNASNGAVPIVLPKQKLVSKFENGRLYKIGRLNVVVMKGSFYQMGRQYGFLLKEELKEFYAMAAKDVGIGTEKYPYNKVLVSAKDELDQQPFYIKEWIRGIGETSGLGVDKQIIFSQMLTPIIAKDAACSGLINWGRYTKDGDAIIGRNWDMVGNTLMPYQKFITVAIFNPIGSAQGVADVNYIGQIVWQNAMNQSGLFYELQNGQMSDPYLAKNRLSSNSALMSMMFDSTSLQQVDAFFDAVRAQDGLIIHVADGKRGYSYEWGTFDYRRRVDDENGMVASANNFVDPSWRSIVSIPDGKLGGFTKERRANLLTLGKKYKGQIDAGKMMEIFDTTIPQGGATFDGSNGFTTYYSIVAVPKELTLWLKVKDLQGWTKVDLKPLFQ